MQTEQDKEASKESSLRPMLHQYTDLKLCHESLPGGLQHLKHDVGLQVCAEVRHLIAQHMAVPQLQPHCFYTCDPSANLSNVCKGWQLVCRQFTCAQNLPCLYLLRSGALTVEHKGCVSGISYARFCLGLHYLSEPHPPDSGFFKALQWHQKCFLPTNSA